MKFPVSMSRGRESRPASTFWIVAKTLWHTLSFTAMFFGFLPFVLREIEKHSPLARGRFARPALRMAASALFLGFAALGMWSSLVMAIEGRGTMLPIDCAPRLVRGGPYRWVRNPMVIAGLGQAFSVGLWHGSPLVLLYALAGGLARHLVLQPWEDADLEARFGQQWRQYKEEVPPWWPRRN